MSRAKGPARADLLRQIEELQIRLEEAEQTLQAIRKGEVDALIVSGSRGELVFSLAGSDAAYRLIVETMKEAALVVSLEGRILFSNGQFGELVRTPLNRVIGHPLEDFVADIGREHLVRLLREAPSHPIKTRIVFRSAQGPVPAHVAAHLIEQPGGASLCLVATDLSELEASTEMLEKLRQQKVLLERSKERFQVLSETANRLLHSKSPQSLIESLCRRVMPLLDCQVFFNYLVNSAAQRLDLNAWAGISDESAAQIKTIRFGEAVCGCVARDGVRIVVANVQKSRDPRVGLVRRFGVRAYACHPLVRAEGILGTLSFGSLTRDRFAADDLSLMKTVADQVAIAIQRLHHLEDLERANTALETRVKERTLDLRHTINDLKQEVASRLEAEARLRRSNLELEHHSEQLRRLASDLTQAEQRERQRLARLLHDHLQQLLVGARYRLEPWQGSSRHELRESIKAADDLLNQAIEVSRSLTAELSPPILQEAGLVPGLEWLVRWMQAKYGLTVDLTVQGTVVPTGENVAVLLFQSVREMLFNVIKHANVKSARVNVSHRPGKLTIVVSDHGSGFDPASLQERKDNGGFGLFSIQERLGLIRGRLQIEAAPGQGSRFTLEAPSDLARPVRRPPDGVPVGATPARPAATRPPEAGAVRRIRVLLVDDHEVTRQGLVLLLKRASDITVVGEAADGEAAIRQASELQPDVVVMDINMPRMNGIEATRRIHRAFPAMSIIGLSMHEEADRAAAMRQAGATGYVTKSGCSETLITAIRASQNATTPSAA